MSDIGNTIKWGIALYDGSVPYKVKIVESSIMYGSGDYEDPPEIRDDRETDCFYVWYESPVPPGLLGSYRSGGGGFETIEEAMRSVEDLTSGTVNWVEDSLTSEMNRQELEKSWQLTRKYLAEARNLLPNDLIKNEGDNPDLEQGSLYWFEDFLDHNELELALQQLEGIGENNNCSSEYWQFLKYAAMNMKLHDRISYYDDKISG